MHSTRSVRRMPLAGLTRRSTRRMPLACAAAVALAAGMLGAAPAHSAVTAAGADLPFTSVEAESATSTGTKIGPDYTQGTLASEASGRQAVRLTAGQRVEFTVPRAANAVNVSYSVPDGQSGTLDVYVNGTKLAKTLAVTSKYSYVDTSWIAGAKTHHLFDNARLLLGQNVQAGDKVAFQATSPKSPSMSPTSSRSPVPPRSPPDRSPSPPREPTPAARGTPPRPSATPSRRPKGEWSGSRRATTGSPRP